MTISSRDMTAPPNLGREHATGPVRLSIPIYKNHLPPCNSACPTGENIQAWLALSQAGKYKDAWLSLVKNNPFPAVSGRICYHNCETACNRVEMDSAVNIHAVERFLGDRAIEENWSFQRPINATGKRIMIVGAGPCGLAAAYHLTLIGHHVEVFEAGPIAGGMMHFGIPAYRLPRDILDAEVLRIEKLGAEIHLNHAVEDLAKQKNDGKFDAVLLATGAHLSKRIDIPGSDAEKILDAISYLGKVASNQPIKIGRRVAVYGGGNTAMDVARTAKRLGASETMIIYRNDREHLAAHDFEAEEALNEDIKIHWLRRIREMNAKEIKVEVMKIGEDGKPIPTGEIETLKADTLIMAIGQNVDSSFLKNIPEIIVRDDGSIEVDLQFMTGKEGIFAGGDMVPGERSATHAFGHGKRAARCIDAWLRGKEYVGKEKSRVTLFEDLRLAYRSFAPGKKQSDEPKEKRIDNFKEIVHGLSEDEALFESRRCLSCGNCFECDGCMAACPQRAIEKVGVNLGYRINLDICTGCAVCVEQCPASSMEMTNE